MKRLGWPRPPMVLGIVVGAIFERYLFISTQLYGWGWLLRWPVLAILACVAWALYRPLSQIVATLIGQFRQVKSRAAAVRRRTGIFARRHRPDRRRDRLVDGLAARRQARAADRLRHGAHRRRSQSGQRTVRPRANGAGACRSACKSKSPTMPVQSQRACQRPRRGGRRGAPAGGDVLCLDGGVYRLCLADRIHPRHRAVRVRLYALRLWRAVAVLARLCRGDDAGLLSWCSTGRCKSPGRRRCSATCSRRCAPRRG